VWTVGAGPGAATAGRDDTTATQINKISMQIRQAAAAGLPALMTT